MLVNNALKDKVQGIIGYEFFFDVVFSFVMNVFHKTSLKIQLEV